ESSKEQKDYRNVGDTKPMFNGLLLGFSRFFIRRILSRLGVCLMDGHNHYKDIASLKLHRFRFPEPISIIVSIYSDAQPVFGNILHRQADFVLANRSLH